MVGNSIFNNQGNVECFPLWQGFSQEFSFYIFEFFLLFMKMFLIHSSSSAAMSHFLAISAKALLNCLGDSVSHCFLFNNLYFLKVTFIFLTKVVARCSQNSLKEI